jgi:outer membrane protein OmpA-like peptidoglycan-associated protein
MITLLLTFFVLLVSLGHIRDETPFGEGRWMLQLSFLQSVKAGFGFKKTLDLGEEKIKYFIINPDDVLGGRTIDAREEGIRRIFQKVSRSMKTMPSQIVAKKTNFSVTDIRFSPDEAVLNEEAKKFLTAFCQDLQHDSTLKAVKLYVLGLAGDEPDEKQRWILSARRARAVADFLKGILPAEYKWPVYSWGAGAGGDWVADDSAVSEQSQILIAILRSGD